MRDVGEGPEPGGLSKDDESSKQVRQQATYC